MAGMRKERSFAEARGERTKSTPELKFLRLSNRLLSDAKRYSWPVTPATPQAGKRD